MAKPFDPWAAGEALIAAEGILCVTCGRPDHEGRLCAADDLVEWPCGSCGHPNLDHDYLLICVGPCRRTNIAAYASGTHVVTIKGVRSRG